MKWFILVLLLSVNNQNLFSQDCGTFHLFNFQNTIVYDWIWDEPKNGFYFDMIYDDLTAENTGYISFALVDQNGDTVTNTEYYRWSYFFPFKAGDTTRYTMVLDDNLSKLPNNFIGFLVTNNPECSIPVNTATTKIVESLDESQLEIFPNPSDEYLNITSNKSIMRIEIFDINGIKRLSVDYPKSVDIRNLTSGVYILNLTFFDKSQKFTKFLKR